MARPRSTDPCMVEGCQQVAVSRHLCMPHYGRWKRGTLTVEAPPMRVVNRCRLPECETGDPVKGDGLCRFHYDQARRPSQRPSREARLCSVEGCGGRHRAKGLCHAHYEAGRRKTTRRVGVNRRSRAQARRVERVRPAPAPSKPKPSKPQGTFRPLTGRGSPSPFDRPVENDWLPDGFIPESKRVGSWWGKFGSTSNERIRVRLHDFDCRWVDLATMSNIDVWEHPKVGLYVIHPRTYARTEFAFCGECKPFQEGRAA